MYSILLFFVVLFLILLVFCLLLLLFVCVLLLFLDRAIFLSASELSVQFLLDAPLFILSAAKGIQNFKWKGIAFNHTIGLCLGGGIGEHCPNAPLLKLL